MNKALVAVSLLTAVTAAPLVARAADLDGLYGGFHLGYTRDSSRLDYQAGGSSPAFDLNGGLFGIQFGYNESITKDMMAGFVIDYSMTNVEGSATSAGTTASAGLDWITSLRGRLGWQGTNTFLYGMAGVNYAKVKVAINNGTNYPDNTMEYGFLLGAGAEMSLNKLLSLQAEVSKTLLNNKNMNAGQIVQTDLAPLMLKAGVNFHFK